MKTYFEIKLHALSHSTRFGTNGGPSPVVSEVCYMQVLLHTFTNPTTRNENSIKIPSNKEDTV